MAALRTHHFAMVMGSRLGKMSSMWSSSAGYCSTIRRFTVRATLAFTWLAPLTDSSGEYLRRRRRGGGDHGPAHEANERIAAAATRADATHFLNIARGPLVSASSRGSAHRGAAIARRRFTAFVA